MSTVINSLSELLKTLTGSLQLHALFPALFFTIMNRIFVLPHFRDLFFGSSNADLDFLDQPLAIALIVFLLGYTLNAVEVPIVRLFEGYLWKDSFFGNLRTNYYKNQFNALHQSLQYYEAKLVEEYLNQGRPERIELYNAKIKSCKIQIADDYPTELNQVLPTRLGNRIAAFETYPREKYCIDSVTFWPRMVPVLAKEGYLPYVTYARSTMDFSLNMSLLLAIFGFESILLRLLLVSEISIFLPIFSFFLCWVFYKAATDIVFDWAVCYETSFDLFRYHLAKSIGLKVAESFDRERQTWRQLSDFWNGQKSPNEFDELDHSVKDWPVHSMKQD